jgi:hypothetical protein
LAVVIWAAVLAPQAEAVLPTAGDIAPIPGGSGSSSKTKGLGASGDQSVASSPAFTGAGFTTLPSPYTDSNLRDRSSYTLRLVANGQGNVETMRAAVQAAASEVAASSGVAITVAAGTVPDTTPDREPVTGEILLSIDSSPPCPPPVAGCGGPRILTFHPYSQAGIVEGGRVWIDPQVVGYTTAQRQHVVDHELGHALGLGHHDADFNGQRQVMHSSSYDASSYRAGDRNGLVFLALKPMPRPSPVVMPNGDEYMFYRGSNDQLQAWFWNGSSWSQLSWGSAGTVAGDPSAVVTTGGVAEVYYRTSTGAMGRWRIAPGFSQNGEYGVPNVTGNPSAVADKAGGVQVFYRMSTGQMGRWWFNGASWNWTDWGYATVGGSPSAVLDANGTYDVIYRTASNNTGRWRFFAGGGYQDLAYGVANVTGTPSVAITAGTNVNAFYRMSTGQLGRWWFNGADWNWTDWGYANVAGNPSVIAMPDDRLEVLYRTTDNSLGRFWFTSSGWNPSTAGSSGELDGDPAAVVKGSRVRAFFGGPDGRFRVFSYEPNGTAWSWQVIG